MIHGSAEARLSRLPAMAGIMALFTSILDTARYSIAAKLSEGGGGGAQPHPAPPPLAPSSRLYARPRRAKPRLPRLPVVINQAFFGISLSAGALEPRNPAPSPFSPLVLR